jgi:hypothetical protein
MAAGAIIGSSIFSYWAANNAADAQGDAADTAADALNYSTDAQVALGTDQLNFDKSMYADFQKFMAPYMAVGLDGISDLEGYKPIDPDSLTKPGELPDFDFKLDVDDEVYKHRQKSGEDAINRALAARGLYDSRAGVNALSEFNLDLMGKEVNDQFARYTTGHNADYSKVIDTFNLGRTHDLDKMGLNEGLYQKILDKIKIGMGGAQATGNSALTTAANTGQVTNSLMNTYGNYGNNMADLAINSGNNEASYWAGLGSMPSNMLAQYYWGNKAGLWGPNTIAPGTSDLDTYFNF